MEWLLLALLIVSNWLWWVFFKSYRDEVGRQWRKAGYDKYVQQLELDHVRPISKNVNKVEGGNGKSS